MVETTEEYRARINQLKSSIENEPYMKNMRPDIAEGISKTGNRQADIEVRQDTLEDDFVAVQQDARSNTPSGAELAVAAGEYNTLGERLDAEEQKVNAQLAHIDSQQITLEGDVDGAYKTGSVVFADLLRTKHITQYAEYVKKVKLKSPVTSTHVGDSLTYGWDIVSSNVRPPDTSLTSDGTSHQYNATRANTTYPEAVQEFLRPVLGDGFSVINRGYSGDYAQESYYHWNATHGGDVTFIMLGTNDANHTSIPEEFYRRLDVYLYWMEQIVVREILWGKAIVLLTPPKLQNPNSSGNKYIDLYRNALYKLGEKYGVNVIDTEMFFANQPSTIYSDSTHYNEKGYRVLGAKVAALILTESLDRPVTADDGEKLLTRESVDGVTYFGDAYNDTVTGADTPAESSTVGNVVGRLNPSGGIVYSFYSNSDDLMIFPYFFSKSTLRIEIDFGTNPSFPSLNNKQYKGYTNNGNSLEITPNGYLNNETFNGNKNNILAIKTKGWHTIKITNVGSLDNCVLQAVSFMRNLPNQFLLVKNKGTDLNNVVGNGTVFEEGSTNRPLGFSDGWVTTYPYEGTSKSLQKFVDLEGRVAYRIKKDNVWGKWKEVNMTSLT